MEEKIIEILAQYSEKKKKGINRKDHLMRDIGLSSIDIVNIIVDLEDEFQVDIPEKLIMQVQSVEDVIDGIQELLADRG